MMDATDKLKKRALKAYRKGDYETARDSLQKAGEYLLQTAAEMRGEERRDREEKAEFLLSVARKIDASAKSGKGGGPRAIEEVPGVAFGGLARSAGSEGSLQRWVNRPLLHGLGWALTGMVFTYVGICQVAGFAWAAELSSTYGFLLIRVVVSVALGVASLFVLPFREGSELAVCLLNVGGLLLPLGLLKGLTLSQRGESLLAAEAEKDSKSTLQGCLGWLSRVALVIVLLVIVVQYVRDIRIGAYDENIYAYLRTSPGEMRWLLGTTAAFLFSNLILSLKQR